MKKYNYILCFALLFLFVCPQAYAIEFGDMSMGPKVDFHGYVSQGYMNSSHNNFFGETEDGTSEFSEIAFNLGSDVTDKLHIGIQLLSRKLGDFGKGDIEIDWGYADYRWKDWLGIRAGKMKLVHGLYNSTRDVDFLRTSIFLPQSVYNEAWRDTVSAVQGGEIYGDIYMGGAGSLAYQLQGGNNEFPVDSGVTTTTSDQLRLLGIEYKADDYYPKYGTAGGLSWTTPVQGLKIGITGWITKFELKGSGYSLSDIEKEGISITAGDNIGALSFETRSAEYTGSIEYSLGDFLFAAEYSRNNYDFWLSGNGFENLSNVNERARAYSHNELETEGYYGMVTYRFTDWFEAGFYYSVYYADTDDKDGDQNEAGTTDDVTSATYNPRKAIGYKDHDAWLKDACLSLKFDINENWVFKVEGHKMDGAAILMKDINTNDYGLLDTEEDWYLGAMKMTFNF